jgi:hypothetical protein
MYIAFGMWGIQKTCKLQGAFLTRIWSFQTHAFLMGTQKSNILKYSFNLACNLLLILETGLWHDTCTGCLLFQEYMDDRALGFLLEHGWKNQLFSFDAILFFRKCVYQRRSVDWVDTLLSIFLSTKDVHK